jgi:hypothetical protein
MVREVNGYDVQGNALRYKTLKLRQGDRLRISEDRAQEESRMQDTESGMANMNILAGVFNFIANFSRYST